MVGSQGIATAPLAAEHGLRCACRHCASGSYQELLSTSDYQRHEITRLTRELAAVRKALALSEAKRLTVEIKAAINRKDQIAWARLVAERAQLAITSDDLIAIQEAA